jgi:nucleotidyltransferase/DNA polymerase involved in DNA repair
MDFVDKLPVRKIPYIGAMRETTLAAMGIHHGRDLRERGPDLFIAYKTHPMDFQFLFQCGMALGLTKHDGGDSTIGQKGVSISETFAARKTLEEFKSKINQLALYLSKEMSR